MMNRIATRPISLYFLNLVAILFIYSTALALEPVAVIVNKTNPASDISVAELASILKGRKLRWNDSQKILKINMPAETTARRDFYQAALDTDPHSKITLPGSNESYDGIIAPNEKAMLALVAGNSNAIGYVYSSNITNSVKVLRISGALPRDSGYPLK